MNIRRGEVAGRLLLLLICSAPCRRRPGLDWACLRLPRGRAARRESELGPGAVPRHCDLAPVLMRGDEVVPAVTLLGESRPSIDLLGDDEVRDAPGSSRAGRRGAGGVGLVGYGGGLLDGTEMGGGARLPGPRS